MLTYKQFLYYARISGPKLFPPHKTSLWLRRTASPPGYGTSGLRHSNTPLRRKDATEITGKNWKKCNEQTGMHGQKVACWLAVKFALPALISEFKKRIRHVSLMEISLGFNAKQKAVKTSDVWKWAPVFVSTCKIELSCIYPGIWKKKRDRIIIYVHGYKVTEDYVIYGMFAIKFFHFKSLFHLQCFPVKVLVELVVFHYSHTYNTISQFNCLLNPIIISLHKFNQIW